jgi:predicted DNA-binding transcriptional regulator AlpA
MRSSEAAGPPLRMRHLVERSGLPRETIHFYIAAGRVPPPRETKRNAAIYGEEHLERLKLVSLPRRAGRRGVPPHDAIVEATATRLRPILLTAGAAVLGAWIIVLDPIFSGLAWAIVFGLVSSTALTLAVVPIPYARLAGKQDREAASPGLEDLARLESRS